MSQPAQRFSDLLGIAEDARELKGVGVKAQLFDGLVLGKTICQQLLAFLIHYWSTHQRKGSQSILPSKELGNGRNSLRIKVTVANFETDTFLASH